MPKSSLLAFVKNEIIGTENTFHAWCVLAAVAGILAMSFYLSSPTVSFHGIADSREPHVNFEFPVEIKAVYVMPGQKVKKGDLLLELSQFEIDSRLRELGTRIVKLKAEKSVRDQMNTAVGNTEGRLSEDPLSLEIRELEIERAYLERRRENLYVFAEIDGIVNAVNFRKGERAKAFDPLVTISSESPAFVQGFIHESLRSGVKVGSQVKVASLTGNGISVSGKVVSLGSRLVPIPERLTSLNQVGAWGREVTIEIPSKSGLLLGERVVISPSLSLFPGMLAQAEPKAPVTAGELEQPVPVRLPPSLVARSRFEASGAAYLPDIRKYIVVSDDTDHRHSPWLFLLSDSGELEDRQIVIPGLKRLEDGESLGMDGNYVYVLESLSSDFSRRRRSGQRLIRSARAGMQLSPAETIDLGTLLRTALRKSHDPRFSEIPAADWDRLEVESHSIHHGDLYLALKAPQARNGGSLLLRLPRVSALFGKGASLPAVDLWKLVQFPKSARAVQRISDLTFVNDTAYFTTTCKHQGCGAFWSLSEKEEVPRLVREFGSEHPEGVAYNPAQNKFLLTFDLGKDGSKFLLLNGPKTITQ